MAAGKIISLDEDVLVQVSGIGPKRASRAAKTLLERGATALVSWGIAGGLVPELSPGSLVLPQTILSTDQTIYTVDAAWRDRFSRKMTGDMVIHAEPVAESTSVLIHPDEKAGLHKRTGAVAVDMESGAVAAEAHRAGVPFLVVRVIADPSSASIPMSALAIVDDFGQLRVFKLIKVLGRDPAVVAALVRQGRYFRAAQRTLRRIARLAGNRFLMPE